MCKIINSNCIYYIGTINQFKKTKIRRPLYNLNSGPKIILYWKIIIIQRIKIESEIIISIFFQYNIFFKPMFCKIVILLLELVHSLVSSECLLWLLLALILLILLLKFRSVDKWGILGDQLFFRHFRKIINYVFIE